jgi:putative FmdB family regulatory protein
VFRHSGVVRLDLVTDEAGDFYRARPHYFRRIPAVPDAKEPMTLFMLQACLGHRTIRRMAIYAYRCVRDGDFDVSRPMGTAARKSLCPVCNSEAARVFRAPMLSLAPRALVAAIDRAEKTSDEPEVVSAVPPRGVRKRNPMVIQNPALQRLPRP